jgi:formylglycine-generating enzyme required for sulfatase activity
MKRFVVGLACLAFTAMSCVDAVAGTVTFGSGVGNTFNMEFMTVGDPGNAAATDGFRPAGAVGYEYRMGKFEVSRDMITKYNANFGTANNLQIDLFNMTPYGGNGVNRPATGLIWNEAARFVNWLNESSGYAPAYKFTTTGVLDNISLWTASDTLDYDASNPYRSKRARFVLPSMNEWYKAAFYDPNKSGGPGYWNYATRSDTAPAVVSGGTGTGVNGNNEAIWGQPNDANQRPADVNNAGGLSAYGVMGLGGNVWEMQESAWDGVNNSGTESRALSGGDWGNFDGLNRLNSDRTFAWGPTQDAFGNYWNGFRVAEVVPEPSMMVIGTLFGLGGLVAKRRRKK